MLDRTISYLEYNQFRIREQVNHQVDRRYPEVIKELDEMIVFLENQYAQNAAIQQEIDNKPVLERSKLIYEDAQSLV
ncbi:hypothetical protein LVD15_25065 [Fulvivirga maritima]|uniref:hypothetical protein n=1 Tax=Fulvivirga maritima TaxID=2904247 RepID=UPI001F48BAA0|nr:hypothetical protein [Fulvivirga maritima]UII26528.1 hypothetical protein LVD15_25065 [Fulvivirga maritima]